MQCGVSPALVLGTSPTCLGHHLCFLDSESQANSCDGQSSLEATKKPGRPRESAAVLLTEAAAFSRTR